MDGRVDRGGWTSGWVWWWWMVDGGLIHIFLNNFISIMNSFIQPTHFSASALTPALSVLPMCGWPIIYIAVLPNGSYYTPINWPPHSSLSFYTGFGKKTPFPSLSSSFLQHSIDPCAISVSDSWVAKNLCGSPGCNPTISGHRALSPFFEGFWKKIQRGNQ